MSCFYDTIPHLIIIQRETVILPTQNTSFKFFDLRVYINRKVPDTQTYWKFALVSPSFFSKMKPLYMNSIQFISLLVSLSFKGYSIYYTQERQVIVLKHVQFSQARLQMDVILENVVQSRYFLFLKYIALFQYL